MYPPTAESVVERDAKPISSLRLDHGDVLLFKDIRQDSTPAPLPEAPEGTAMPRSRETGIRIYTAEEQMKRAAERKELEELHAAQLAQDRQDAVDRVAAHMDAAGSAPPPPPPPPPAVGGFVPPPPPPPPPQ